MNWHAQHDTIHGFTPLNKWSNFRPVVLGSSGPSLQWGQDKLLQACLPSNPATRAQGSMTAPTTRSSASCFSAILRVLWYQSCASVSMATTEACWEVFQEVLENRNKFAGFPQVCGRGNPPACVASKLAASNNNSFQTTLSTTTMPAFRARSPAADSPLSFCPCF